MHVILKIWFLQNGPINVTLFTTAEREWETCRHNIDDQVLERNKIDCPSCGKEPLVRSSDAIVKLNGKPVDIILTTKCLKGTKLIAPAVGKNL
jgi:predicted RNA-binding Zn-ribbon protein involved in translation (DUF1610 family)